MTTARVLLIALSLIAAGLLYLFLDWRHQTRLTRNRYIVRVGWFLEWTEWWIGARWDSRRRSLYIGVPFVGLVVSWIRYDPNPIKMRLPLSYKQEEPDHEQFWFDLLGVVTVIAVGFATWFARTMP